MSAHQHPGHSHSHGHVHGGLHGGAHPHLQPDHHRHGDTGGWRYGLAIILNFAIVAVQAIIGFRIGSSALMADAGHNASDVAGLLLAGGAAWLMTRQGPDQRTYGYGKAGVIAAILNSLLLVFACGMLVLDAVTRLINPPVSPPPGTLVMAIAAAAVVVNMLSGGLLTHGHPDDVNRRAAVIHLFADAAVSGAVVLAGALIMLTGARWIDPVASLLIVAVIVATSWRVLVQALNMAMDAAPAGISVVAVRQWLGTMPGVQAVHDLHIWPMSATETALTVHLVVPKGGSDGLLSRVNTGLSRQFGIVHATIQIEQTDIDTCTGLHG